MEGDRNLHEACVCVCMSGRRRLAAVVAQRDTQQQYRRRQRRKQKPASPAVLELRDWIHGWCVTRSELVGEDGATKPNCSQLLVIAIHDGMAWARPP